jgi:hypothetical protein
MESAAPRQRRRAGAAPRTVPGLDGEDPVLEIFSEGNGTMAESTVNLTDEEHKFLVELLEIALKDTQVEEHRTRKLTYREHILQRENVISGLLRKLGKQSK